MSKPDLPGDSHFRLEVWAETLDDSEIENCKLQIANCRNETFERLLSTCAPSGSRIQVSKSQCRSFLHFAFFNFQFAISNPPQTQALLYFLVDELKYYCYYRRRLDYGLGLLLD